MAEPGLIKTRCNPAPTFSSCLPLNHHLPFQSGPNLHPDFFLLHLTSASCNHPHGAQFQHPSSGKPSWLLPLKFFNSVCASLPTPGIVLCVHNLSCTPGGQELRALQLGSPWRAPCPVPSIHILTYTIFLTAWCGEGFQKGSPNQTDPACVGLWAGWGTQL